MFIAVSLSHLALRRSAMWARAWVIFVSHDDSRNRQLSFPAFHMELLGSTPDRDLRKLRPLPITNAPLIANKRHGEAISRFNWPGVVRSPGNWWRLIQNLRMVHTHASVTKLWPGQITGVVG
jgi:hypothetical protein